MQRATQDAFGWGFPERGLMTIWLGHLLVGMAYAAVIVQARLQEVLAPLPVKTRVILRS